MGVVSFRKGVHVQLVHILSIGLLCSIQSVFESFDQEFLNGLGVFICQFQINNGVLQALAPQVIEFGFAGSPGNLLTVYEQRFGSGEIKTV